MAFYGEGDELPGVQAGDVQVVIRIQKHKTFKRKGADIMIEK
jgi:DnaJ-class molecular chaperone